MKEELREHMRSCAYENFYHLGRDLVDFFSVLEGHGKADVRIAIDLEAI